MCILQDGQISFAEFLQAMSVTSRGTIDEKLDGKYTISGCIAAPHDVKVIYDVHLHPM